MNLELAILMERHKDPPINTSRGGVWGGGGGGVGVYYSRHRL
jgi:hypothetical protein